MKKFKITEEQIKEVYNGGGLILKEWFPEVFETKLEVGKWYKSVDNPTHIFCVKELGSVLNRYYYYGINSIGEYKSHDFYSFNDVLRINGYILATEEEVFNALKKEAEKRGFVKGVKFISVANKTETILDEKINYISHCNTLYVGLRDISGVIFEKGKWAEIISQPEEIIELNGFKYKRID